MPPRSTCPGAVTKGPCVTPSTPLAIGAIGAGVAVTVTYNLPRNFRPGVATFIILSGPLDNGILSDVTVTGNAPNYVANIRFFNSTGGSVTPTTTIKTIFQE